MRPPKESQGALRTPLNRLFGTEANVRILRVLSAKERAWGVSELARRTALSYTAVSRALEGLVDSGIVDPVGSDRALRVRFRSVHPLADAVRALFSAERERRARVLDGIRSAVAALSTPPRAVWLEGAVATDADELGDPLIVGLLAGSGDLASVQETLRGALGEIERNEDVTIEIRGRTIPDLAAATDAEIARLRDAVPIMGPAPAAYLHAPPDHGTRPTARSHADLDARSRAFASAIADRILKEPEIVQRAREYLKSRLEEASPGERKELLEWAQVLDTASIGRLRRFLLDGSERAMRLRQTMPFLHLLSAEERAAITKQEDHDPGRAGARDTRGL